MHTLFVSDGVILSKRAAGEANVLVSILTKELGIVRAHARSARAEKSKLRYALEPLTCARFTFVRGKHEWKLVGAENALHVFSSAPAPRRRAAGRIIQLLSRLVHGEERVPQLYKNLADGFLYLARAVDDTDAESIECVIVLRILAHLGYLPKTRELLPFIEADFFSMELAAQAARSRALLIRTINESLGMTGL